MNVPSPPSDAPARFDRRAWITLLVLCGVLFLDGLDVSMVGVALPSIDADLDMSTSALQWVVSGYALTFGGFLLLGGRLGDLLGRRRIFMLGLLAFAGFSLLCGLSQSDTMLIVARLLQGAAGAILAPSVFSITMVIFAEGAERNKALGTLGAFLAGRSLQAQLFAVDPLDPLTMATVAVLLLLVAAIASVLPSRRAVRADPHTALRAD